MLEAVEEAQEPKLTLHILRWVPMVIILGLLVHFVLPRIGTIQDSLQTLQAMRPWPLAVAIAAQVLSYVANGLVLQSVVALTGARIPLRRAVAIEIGAGTVALVAAGVLGFGAAIYKWTHDSGLPQRTAMLVSWLPSLFDSAALALFALASAVELLHVHRLSRTTLIALLIVICLLTAFIVGGIVLLARNDWLKAVATFASKVFKRIRPSQIANQAAHTWQTLRGGGWVRPACSSLLVLTFDFLSLRYAFLAAGRHLHFTVLIAGYGVPLLLGRSSFLPGGIAVIEVAMAAIYSGLGIPAGAAVVAVLTYRLISFWLPAIIGIPIAITLQSRRKR